jgi:SAM-dependent methyltransferase
MLLVEECAVQLAPDTQSLATWHRTYVSNHATRLAFDLDIAREFAAQRGRVLEAGSIPLLFTAAMSRCGYDITGCDIAPERYSSAIHRLGLKVVKCNIETDPLPFDGNSFEAIVFNEIFEHLRINPIFTMTEVLRVMKPGAILMLSSPNLRSLDGIVNFLFRNECYSCCSDPYDEYHKLQDLGHMGHVREYTTKEVTHFLEKVGFRVTNIVYRGWLNSRMKRSVTRLVPSLRPFVSYIACKR